MKYIEKIKADIMNMTAEEMVAVGIRTKEMDIVCGQIDGCGDIGCDDCKYLIAYLNSEVPQNPLEKIGAVLMDITQNYEYWGIKTKDGGTVHITVDLKFKQFNATGSADIITAKAIIEYLETL